MTGFEEETMEYIYMKYSHLPSCRLEKKDFENIFTYLHLYPTERQATRILDCSKYYLGEKLFPGIKWLAAHLEEIFWGDRLSQWNHTPFFPSSVTCKFFFLFLFK